MSKDLQYWLILNHAPGLGPARTKKLLAIYGTPENIIKDKMKALASLKLPEETIYALKHPDQRAIDTCFEWAKQSNQRIITQTDPEYPKLLQEITQPPPVLYIKGNIATLHAQQIAIVGSRNPSPVGREIAQEFASSLTQAGFCITSGLALGIDAAGHRGALSVASGHTIAVLGHGLATIYPHCHRQLAEEITSNNGCLISEFPLKSMSKAQHFPQRNRIISGLSLGTLIVEAKPRSGSLITARFAIEQNREVFAIPGSIRNPLARGCHKLIRNGAKLVETIDDILEELNIDYQPAHQNTINLPKSNHLRGLEKQHVKLLQCVDFETTSIDQMIARSQFSASTVSAILLILELHGYISAVPGGYRRVK